MSVSPPSTPPFTLEEMFPPTLRERHCKIEDWFRYIGGGVSLVGSSTSFYFGCPTPGILLTITGATFLVSHLIEKNCGLRARAAAAAQKVLERYQTSAVTLNEATVRLEMIGDDRKHDTEELGTEQTSLITERHGLEESIKQMQENVMHYQTENLALKTTNEQHQQTIELQAGLIAGMEKNLAQFTEQNNRVHKDLTEFPQLISSLNEADNQLAVQTSATTTGLQQGLHEFEDDIAQIQNVNADTQLQIRIDDLREQTAALGKARAGWQADIHTISETQKVRSEIGNITENLRLGHTQLLATEQQINIELASLKDILQKGHHDAPHN